MSDDDVLADLLVGYEDAIERGVPMTPEQVCRERRDLLPRAGSCGLQRSEQGTVRSAGDGGASAGAIADGSWAD